MSEFWKFFRFSHENWQLWSSVATVLTFIILIIGYFWSKIDLPNRSQLKPVPTLSVPTLSVPTLPLPTDEDLEKVLFSAGLKPH